MLLKTVHKISCPSKFDFHITTALFCLLHLIAERTKAKESEHELLLAQTRKAFLIVFATNESLINKNNNTSKIPYRIHLSLASSGDTFIRGRLLSTLFFRGGWGWGWWWLRTYHKPLQAWLAVSSAVVHLPNVSE